LIVRHLADDEDLEELLSRQILYTFDTEKLTLRRVEFPKMVQQEEWNRFVIDIVAPSAVLLRWDTMNELMTVYLGGLYRVTPRSEIRRMEPNLLPLYLYITCSFERDIERLQPPPLSAAVQFFDFNGL
jgi:hypothetical protein